MKKIVLSIVTLMIMIIRIKANSLTESFEEITVNGYLRAAYEVHNVKDDDTFKDGALGGKLHIETAPRFGMSIGASFYTSNAFGDTGNKGLVPFRGEVANAYSILGEAYFKMKLGDTLLKFGRQEIDTPFADTDDIGIVPNTFEAYILENKDIADTTFFIGQINKMAGVDAEIIDTFTRINSNNDIQVAGITYTGIENMELSAWYYRLKEAEVDSIHYLEVNYESKNHGLDFSLGIQYAKETYMTQNDASVYGFHSHFSHEKSGFTLGVAFNKADGNAAFSGFGGGPFYTNSEYLIIDNAGVNGSQTWFGLEYDASTLGLTGLTVGLSKAILKNKTKQRSTEVDFVASYEVDKNIEFHMIYSDLDGGNVGEDTAKHLRVFANYNF